MTTIKSYTSLEQSKKLAEILPIESADMYYQVSQSILFPKEREYSKYPFVHTTYVTFDNLNVVYPCWSLTALLNTFSKGENIDCSISFGYYKSSGEYIEKWLCTFEKEGETIADYIIESADGDNPVDACYEMIIKLHEQNLL